MYHIFKKGWLKCSIIPFPRLQRIVRTLMFTGATAVIVFCVYQRGQYFREPPQQEGILQHISQQGQRPKKITQQNEKHPKISQQSKNLSKPSKQHNKNLKIPQTSNSQYYTTALYGETNEQIENSKKPKRTEVRKDHNSHSPTSNINKDKQPNQHVGFVKVHKAASSTMHNILTRYALRYDLDEILNKHSIHINQNSYSIRQSSLVPTTRGRSKYSIQCCHLIFNHKTWARFLPNDTVYVGIVREPFSQFLSAFVYYKLSMRKAYFNPIFARNPENPVEEFLNNTSAYTSRWNTKEVMINNRMSIDFGFPLYQFESSKTNKTKISTFVNDLDRSLDIVLIAEMFDESLVLLRRLLNWTTKDIMYMKVNVFKQKESLHSWTRRKQYPSHTMELFKKYAAYDIALYDHFYKKFKQRIEAQPKDFHAEVEVFKRLKDKVAKVCSEVKDTSSTWQEHIPGTAYTSGFTLTSGDCALMTSEAKTLTQFAKKAQINRLNEE